ncbi:unnamed protein product, partial [Rotaria sordida]
TLARFIDRRFYEITKLQKPDNDFIRSVQTCRLYLRKWGVRFEADTGRPYYLGHERDDVVKHRQEFIKYSVEHEKNFYAVTNDTNPK